MATGESGLRAKACAQWTAAKAQQVMDGFEGALRALTGDLSNVSDVVEAGGALQITLDYILNDPTAWVAFALAQAKAGTLLQSSALDVEWYVVTHKGPCAGARVTVGKRARKEAEALGVALAAPSIVAANPGLNGDALFTLEKDLAAAGMLGLQPVIGAIVDGFNDGGKVWADGAKPRGFRSGPNTRAVRMLTKFKADKDPIPPDEGASSSVVVVISAAVGWALAGPVGGLAGGVAGAILSNKLGDQTEWKGQV